MLLWEFLDEQVIITTTDGNVYRGLADIYHSAEDTSSGIASLTIALTKRIFRQGLHLTKN